MQIIRSQLFQKIPELIFGLSTRYGLKNDSPFNFNLSLTVGDDPAAVHNNREFFFNELNLTTEMIAFQKQIHSGIITYVEKPGSVGESDALFTDRHGIGLAVSTADCVPVFIYDKKRKIIAGIHSGWRGTREKILLNTLIKLNEQFDSDAADIIAYIGPSITRKNYEVGQEVAVQFGSGYINRAGGKIFLDVLQVNVDMLLEFGIPVSQIEVSPLCSFEAEDLLHSYRRDGKYSGRALGVIALKGK